MDKASNYQYSDVDNMVQRWRTYHARRFIHKIDLYKWIYHDKESTYNSNNQYANRMTAMGHQLN